MREHAVVHAVAEEVPLRTQRSQTRDVHQSAGPEGLGVSDAAAEGDDDYLAVVFGDHLAVVFGVLLGASYERNGQDTLSNGKASQLDKAAFRKRKH